MKTPRRHPDFRARIEHGGADRRWLGLRIFPAEIAVVIANRTDAGRSRFRRLKMASPPSPSRSKRFGKDRAPPSRRNCRQPSISTRSS